MNQVQPPFDPLLQNWRHFAHDPVTCPVSCSAETCAFGSNAQRQNFRRIKPRDRAPGCTKCRVVDHNEDDCKHRCGANIDENEVRDCRKGNDHGNSSRKQDLASTPFVNQVPWRDSRKEISQAVDASHEDSATANPACRLKHKWGVIGYDIDAIELCQSLRGHGDEETLVIFPEHFIVGSFTFLPLKKHIHLDLTVLLSRFVVVDIASPVKIGNDHNAFLVMIVVQEPPARRLDV